MLKVDGLDAWYGSTQVLFGVSFTLSRGETLALVGTNGAGKTTTLGAIVGLVRSSGTVELNGHSINSLSTYKRIRRGIGLVPEGRQLFGSLNVRENLAVGAGGRGSELVDQTLEVFPALKDKMHMAATNLSGGEQQMVAIARAILRKPDVLLIDEPSLGLAPAIIDSVYDFLRKWKESQGTTILLVEQDMTRASALANRLCLIRAGRTLTTVEARNVESFEALRRQAFGGQTSEGGAER